VGFAVGISLPGATQAMRLRSFAASPYGLMGNLQASLWFQKWNAPCGDEKCIFAGFLETHRMQGQRPAHRVGRSDSRVTGIAAGADLAAMLAILQAVIGSCARHCGLVRASLRKNLVLRQQLAILRRNAASPAPSDRPCVLGHGRPRVVASPGTRPKYAATACALRKRFASSMTET
jgi:hypothetical protein